MPWDRLAEVSRDTSIVCTRRRARPESIDGEAVKLTENSRFTPQDHTKLRGDSRMLTIKDLLLRCRDDIHRGTGTHVQHPTAHAARIVRAAGMLPAFAVLRFVIQARLRLCKHTLHAKSSCFSAFLMRCKNTPKVTCVPCAAVSNME